MACLFIDLAIKIRMICDTSFSTSPNEQIIIHDRYFTLLLLSWLLIFFLRVWSLRMSRLIERVRNFVELISIRYRRSPVRWEWERWRREEAPEPEGKRARRGTPPRRSAQPENRLFTWIDTNRRDGAYRTRVIPLSPSRLCFLYLYVSPAQPSKEM